MIDLDAIRKALTPTREGLEAAGFDMALDERHGGVVLTVIAGMAACEECLVPKAMFRRMANDEIDAAGLEPTEIKIVYPIDGRKKLS